MPYPTQEALGLPLLRAIARRDGAAIIFYQGEDIADELAKEFGLTLEEQYRKDHQNKARDHSAWFNQIQFARRKLAADGLLVTGPERDDGVWKLSPDGYRAIGMEPPES